MKELIIMTGFPASGKTTFVKQYADNGSFSISRDVEGGSLKDMEPLLQLAIDSGKNSIIMDGTYLQKESRKTVVEIGKRNGYKVISFYVSTSFEDSQFNAVSRMIKRHGKLFRTSDDYKSSNDPNAFPPAALYKAKKMLEKPTIDEGFDEIVVKKFHRTHNGYTNKALILDYDGTLRITKSGAKFPTSIHDISILPGRIEKLNEYKDKGYILLGVSNQSGVAKGDLSYEKARACFDKTNELLGLDIEVSFCPHSVPPITCYCRKPGVGHGVEFIEKFKLDPSSCIMVGDMTTDETFAKRCGFKYVTSNRFFS